MTLFWGGGKSESRVSAPVFASKMKYNFKK
jgi:hypothetical protein